MAAERRDADQLGAGAGTIQHTARRMHVQPVLTAGFRWATHQMLRREAAGHCVPILPPWHQACWEEARAAQPPHLGSPRHTQGSQGTVGQFRSGTVGFETTSCMHVRMERLQQQRPLRDGTRGHRGTSTARSGGDSVTSHCTILARRCPSRPQDPG